MNAPAAQGRLALDQALMKAARERAAHSTDRSRQVGCVITTLCGTILSDGWNTTPRGCAHTEERHARPAKYAWTEHAERNAIYAAARKGIPLQGCVAYVPWYPCADCARGLIQSGIIRMVAHAPDFDDPQWDDDFRVASEMLEEAGIRVDLIEGDPPAL